MPRLPLVDPARLTPAQKEVYDQIAGGSRGRVGVMYSALLNSPGISRPLEKVGAYLRYDAPLTDRVKELAICIVSAHWQADVEWATHSALARKAGVPDTVLAAIASGAAPDFTDPTDRIAYAYVREVLPGQGLTDQVFRDAFRAFGTESLVDLTAIAGYYTMLALMLNAFEWRPEGADIPWRK